MTDQLTGLLLAFRCHVCGFETDGRTLFQSHMTEHRQWEHASFSLHCCACDHSTNQEAEMRAHANTHMQGIMGVSAEMRCVTETVHLYLTVKLSDNKSTQISDSRFKSSQLAAGGMKSLSRVRV